MLLATLLCYVGFSALCLSMARHYEVLIGGTLSSSRSQALRLLGWAALLLSPYVALGAEGLGQALVQWCAALMGSAVVLVFVMAYRPRLALSLAGVGVLLSPVAAFYQCMN